MAHNKKIASRVLIAEDDETNLRTLHAIVEKAGHEVTCARNGQEAISLLSSNGYDLALIDIMMPKIDGYDVCRWMKSDARCQDIPIIFVTAKTDVEDESLGFTLGAVDYIAKPINGTTLVSRLKTHLALATAMRNLHEQGDILRAHERLLEERVRERTEGLTTLNKQLKSEIESRLGTQEEMTRLLLSIDSILIAIDIFNNVFRFNYVAEKVFNIAHNKIIGHDIFNSPIYWDNGKIFEGMLECGQHSRPVKITDIWYETPSGLDGLLSITITALRDQTGVTGYLLLGSDITELRLQESRILQTSKFEAIGNLAAGIAHEINTPAQIVNDSMDILSESFDDLCRIISLAEEDCQVNSEEKQLRDISPMSALLDEVDSKYLKTEIPRTLARAKDGIGRISTIVQAMSRFSDVGRNDKIKANICRAIERTLVISRNEWKDIAEIVTEFDPGMLDVTCFPGEINQVLLSIILNATHAVGDVVRGTDDKGLIKIKTTMDSDYTQISIQDTGTGIPANVRDKVFNLFFTTKEVGKGSGQGLAISYDIIVNRHGGTIDFESEEGVGTTFYIRLPIGS